MKSEKEFYIIMGRSGCGKGTQSKLLKAFLYNKNKEVEKYKALHITTGGNFRELVKREMYTANETRNTLNSGGLMPEFLAIWNWANIFINNLESDDTVILDGAPRKEIEVDALDSAINFYNYKKVNVIYLNVTKEWAVDRLIGRGREDDNQREEQERKMSWFETDVLPCINLYKNKANYNFIEINGEQSMEDVQREIREKLS